jgi:hypothetical protein
MTKERKMNKDAYDGYASGDDDTIHEIGIGFFEDTNTLVFTKNEWEAFKKFGDTLFESGDDGWVHQELDDEDIALIKERLKERGRTVTLEELI